MSYCEYINTITGWALDLNKTYHDEKYGFPIEDDNELFGRLELVDHIEKRSCLPYGLR